MIYEGYYYTAYEYDDQKETIESIVGFINDNPDTAPKVILVIDKYNMIERYKEILYEAHTPFKVCVYWLREDSKSEDDTIQILIEDKFDDKTIKFIADYNPFIAFFS
jgi:hypothetical protein